MKSLLALLALCVTITGTAANAKTELEIEAGEIESALDMYFVDCHEFPRSLDGLLSPPDDCKGMWGPDRYLLKNPANQWTHQWQYERTDPNNFVLKTYGDFVVNGTAPKKGN